MILYHVSCTSWWKQLECWQAFILDGVSFNNPENHVDISGWHTRLFFNDEYLQWRLLFFQSNIFIPRRETMESLQSLKGQTLTAPLNMKLDESMDDWMLWLNESIITIKKRSSCIPLYLPFFALFFHSFHLVLPPSLSLFLSVFLISDQAVVKVVWSKINPVRHANGSGFWREHDERSGNIMMTKCDHHIYSTAFYCRQKKEEDLRVRLQFLKALKDCKTPFFLFKLKYCY